ncbi:MAG: winged helix-turn-helix transcriptional regulator [Kutzneria sp.]|nr:winged helix-turn-helix transcriptional regulator [Kutzneria sp.]
MMEPLMRSLIAAELPVLRAHGLTMWGYRVLSALDGQPVRTQTSLAQSIGADKTRIIGVLDELQRQGLIDRQADPVDRRANLVSVTAAGHRVRIRAQAEIQRNEERLLDQVSQDDRRGFLRALRTLSSSSQPEIVRGPDSTE